MKFKLNLFSCFFFFFLPQLSFSQNTCPSVTQQKVMLLGDSWTHIMWDLKTYRDVFDQFGYTDIHERGNNTAIGGTTATYWADPANLAVVINELQQNPSIKIVLISIGGNDMLAGNVGGGWNTGLSVAAETFLMDSIQANMQTMVDGIKAVHPDIEIVFSGYDFINLVETVINDPGGPNSILWFNLGQPNAQQLNTAFSKLEQRKINIANSDPRVHYVNSMGLMQFVFGYPGYFPPYVVPAPGNQPPNYLPFPGGDITYPTPPIALADNGNDAIHLSAEGYRHLVVHQMSAFFLNKFRGNYNATFKSEGGNFDGWIRTDGTTGTGNVRLGDFGNNQLYRGVVSFNTSSIPDNAIVTGGSIYLNRSGLSGQNPFSGVNWGNPSVDVISGTFGGAQIEAGDYLAPASGVDVGCFTGTAHKNSYTIRVDLKPDGYSNINTIGRTQFRFTFQIPSGTGNDYILFNNGDQPGLLAPYLDVFYTVTTDPPTAILSGDTTICPNSEAYIKVYLTGIPPWILSWSDGTVESNILTSPHIRSLPLASSTTFSLLSVSDANGAGNVSGNFMVNVQAETQVSLTGLNANYCANSPVSTLITNPSGGTWTGMGILNNTTFNPEQAIIEGASGSIVLTYSGMEAGCPYSQDFNVFVDTADCSQTPVCSFSTSSGTVDCVGSGTATQTFSESGEMWVFDGLIPGKTYTMTNCPGCNFDAYFMIRNEADSSLIVQKSSECSGGSTPVFIAPASGKVGVNLTDQTHYDCNPYNCNPFNCNPYNCNPYNCNPYTCNCQTCYETCYKDEEDYLPCSNDWETINGILTSPCIGACTFGGCWRMQYNIPYNCNVYTCNCQTCYDTCYDTCYNTCFDTCYESCTDVCGTGNQIPCDVIMQCLDCTLPTATISSNQGELCVDDITDFFANINEITCNTTYLWDFGMDANQQYSNDLNPEGISWTSSGTKLISFLIEEYGIPVNTYSMTIEVAEKPTGGNLNVPQIACDGDSVNLVVDGMQWATHYHWDFGNWQLTGTSNDQTIEANDTILSFYVVGINNGCEGDTLWGKIQVGTIPNAEIFVNGNNPLCLGDSVELIASGGSTYSWSHGETDQAILVTPQENTVYEVEVFNDKGCSSISTTVVMVSGMEVKLSQTGDTLFVPDNYVSYQWFFNGEKIKDAVSYFYNADRSGNYQLQLIDQSGCYVWTDVVNVLLSTTSQVEVGEFVIYPNPSFEKIYITYSDDILIENYVLYNLLGKKVFSEAGLKEKITEIDISQLSQGIYFLRLNNTSVFKVVKQ